MKLLAKNLVGDKRFENFIIFVIILNSVLIGVETYFTNSLIAAIQLSALCIFTIEVIIRMLASKGVKDYLSVGWNIFDLVIVLISFIPESIFENTSTVSAIRVLRVFRVLRLLRTSDEIKLIISVLIRSVRSLFYNALFFAIFLYLFAIIGVTLFRMPDSQQANPETLKKLQEYHSIAPHAPSNSADPYGTLGEAFFTLFRIMTGDDWTDIRYNLITAKNMGLIQVSTITITTFHVIWFIIAAFLLLNLVVGAILNNYQIIMDEVKQKKLGHSSAA